MESWRTVLRASIKINTSIPHVSRSFGQSQLCQTSASATVNKSLLPKPQILTQSRNVLNQLPALSVMPTGILIRSLLITYILSSPRLVSLSLPLMARICNKEAWLLNPDRNFILRAVIKKLFYNHFCAGENEEEIKQNISTMKKMGFEGVIMGYARETVVDKSATAEEAAGLGGSASATEKAIIDWKLGTLRTLSMLGNGDFIGVKYATNFTNGKEE